MKKSVSPMYYFVLGGVEMYAVTQFHADLLGLERYMDYIRAAWVNTPPWLWAVVIAVIIGLYATAHIEQTPDRDPVLTAHQSALRFDKWYQEDFLIHGEALYAGITRKQAFNIWMSAHWALTRPNPEDKLDE